MPNSWDHHQPGPDAACIAPLVAPYGRWNVDEIIWASLPSVIIITLWRIFFSHLLGPYFGGYVARRENPNPHPKPEFISIETDTSKLKKLQQFYNKIEYKKSKVPKRKKKSESEQQKSDLQLTTNIKRRNEIITKK
eukprot:31521_1